MSADLRSAGVGAADWSGSYLTTSQLVGQPTASPETGIGLVC